MNHQGETGPGHGERGHYRALLVMLVLSFIAMYVLMYAMVDDLANVHHNMNQVYMAGLMAAAMVPIELLVMRRMYPMKRRNAIIVAFGLLTLAACFLFIRRQTAIGDRQFLKSMIPHHAGAILMCEEASLTDQDILRLCQQIIDSQRREIDQMKAMLREME